MARGRLISTSLGSSRKFRKLELLDPDLGDFAGLLFCMIVSHTDDFGLLEADAETIKLKVFPGSSRKESEFLGALRLLDNVDLIRLYQVDGEEYLQVLKFDEHQAGLHKRTKPKYPEPPKKLPGNSRKFQEVPSEEKGIEEKRREPKGTEAKGREAKAPDGARLSAFDPVFEAFVETCGFALDAVEPATAGKLTLGYETFKRVVNGQSPVEQVADLKQFRKWHYEIDYQGHFPLPGKVAEKWLQFQTWRSSQSPDDDEHPPVYLDVRARAEKAAAMIRDGTLKLEDLERDHLQVVWDMKKLGLDFTPPGDDDDGSIPPNGTPSVH